MIWLKGDLHCHSKFSDGDSSVGDVLDEARNRANLDFLSITDHDTHFESHPDRISTWYDPDYFSSPDLALLYGIEWTDSRGHANIWSLEAYDYSAIWATNQSKDVNTAIRLAHEKGALFSYNHPESSDPWKLATSPEVDCVEIWNSVSDYNHNFQATFKFWDDLLQSQGRRITAVGGSDLHDLHGAPSLILKFGRPRVWVLSQAKSPRAILDAIRQGRVTLSANEDAPRLEIRADHDLAGGYETRLGDTVSLSSDAQVGFRITLDDGGAQGSMVGLEQAFLDDINARLAAQKDYLITHHPQPWSRSQVPVNRQFRSGTLAL